jgi:hypothetical protein
MAVLNRKYGYLFLAEPHCASRAVGEALAQHEGSVVLDTWVHNPLSALVELGFVRPHETLFKFSVVRHPADFLVTKYHHLTGWHAKGFRAFLHSELEKLEPLFMHANWMDRTIRYERLQSELNDVLEARGAPPVTLNVIGKTENKKPWRSYYTDRDLRLLNGILSEVLIYGYTL